VDDVVTGLRCGEGEEGAVGWWFDKVVEETRRTGRQLSVQAVRHHHPGAQRINRSHSRAE